MGRNRIGRALVAIALAVVVGVGASAPAGSAQTPPWETMGAGGATSTGGAANGVVLVGDSLIAWPSGPGTVANAIRTASGYATYANAAPGAQWVTYGWPGQQNGNALIWDYAAFFNARLTIGALATNDARIMTSHPGSYSQGQQYAIMSNAVDLTRDRSECVMLVNVRRRNGVPAMSYANAQKVNDNMAWLAASFPGGGVHLANWDAHAAGHDTDWFNPGDVHLSAAGTSAYNAFIASEADRLIDQGC